VQLALYEPHEPGAVLSIQALDLGRHDRIGSAQPEERNDDAGSSHRGR
jgi:hypothetical protein